MPLSECVINKELVKMLGLFANQYTKESEVNGEDIIYESVRTFLDRILYVTDDLNSLLEYSQHYKDADARLYSCDILTRNLFELLVMGMYLTNDVHHLENRAKCYYYSTYRDCVDAINLFIKEGSCFYSKSLNFKTMNVVDLIGSDMIEYINHNRKEFASAIKNIDKLNSRDFTKLLPDKPFRNSKYDRHPKNWYRCTSFRQLVIKEYPCLLRVYLCLYKETSQTVHGNIHYADFKKNVVGRTLFGSSYYYQWAIWLNDLIGHFLNCLINSNVVHHVPFSIEDVNTVVFLQLSTWSELLDDSDVGFEEIPWNKNEQFKKLKKTNYQCK